MPFVFELLDQASLLLSKLPSLAFECFAKFRFLADQSLLRLCKLLTLGLRLCDGILQLRTLLFKFRLNFLAKPLTLLIQVGSFSLDRCQPLRKRRLLAGNRRFFRFEGSSAIVQFLLSETKSFLVVQSLLLLLLLFEPERATLLLKLSGLSCQRLLAAVEIGQLLLNLLDELCRLDQQVFFEIVQLRTAACVLRRRGRRPGIVLS